MLDTRSVAECLFDILQKRGAMTRDALRKYGRNIKTRKCPRGCDSATADRKLRLLTEQGRVLPLNKKGAVVTGSSQFIYKYCVCG